MHILIVRFSSFGDIFQALEAAAHLQREPNVKRIGWLVRQDFAPILYNQPVINTVHSFSRNQTILQLIAMTWKLGHEYDALYDAHLNLRSFFVRNTFRLCKLTQFRLPQVVVRSKERLRRFLFFRLRLNTLPSPYRGAESYLRPLLAKKWFPQLNFDFSKPQYKTDVSASSALLKEFAEWQSQHARPVAAGPILGRPIIALAPSAAWPNKRWPVERWLLLAKALIAKNPESRFVLLGGPEDLFLNKIATDLRQDLVFNIVGRSSLLESVQILSQCTSLIANDTGLLHVADRLHLPSVAIIGPTAFGYTVSPVSRIAEVDRHDLPCKPCSKDGRDRCTNTTLLRCLLDVSVAQVASLVKV